MRHQAAERAAGKKQRHAAEEGSDDGEEPLLHERLVDSAANRFDLDRRRSVQASDRGPQRLANCSGGRRSYLRVEATRLQDLGRLHIGNEDGAARVVLKALVN